MKTLVAGLVLLLALSYGCLFGSNHAPVITSLTATPAVIHLNGVAELFCNAEDKDSDPLIYQWLTDSGNIQHLGEGHAVFSPVVRGRFIIQCTVSDDHGASDTDEVLVTVIR